MASPLRLGSLEVYLGADAEHPPIEIEARVFEEDRFLVLSAPPFIPETSAHPIRVMTGVLEMEPRAVGDVFFQTPRRLLAVVHDLEREPTTRSDWIQRAVREALTLADRQDIKALALPALGAVHGDFGRRRSLEIVIAALNERWFHGLKRVWLLADEEEVEGLAHSSESEGSEGSGARGI